MEPIAFHHRVAIHRLELRLEQLQKERSSCSDFDCARQSAHHIQVAKADLDIANLARQEAIAKADLPYEQAGRDIMLDVYLRVLQENLGKDPRVKHLSMQPMGDCGEIKLKERIFHPLPDPFVCREVELEFELGNKFHRLSLAVGTVRKHFDWDGHYHPVFSSLGLRELQSFLANPVVLKREASLERLFEAGGRGVSFYRGGRYMLGSTSAVGVVLLAADYR